MCRVHPHRKKPGMPGLVPGHADFKAKKIIGTKKGIIPEPRIKGQFTRKI